MSNDGRSIGEHLRDTEAAVVPDSSADSSATRQSGEGWQRDTDVTNRAPSERESRERVPPRRNRKDGAHAQ